MAYCIVEQDEGLMVETQSSADVYVFVVDYDECKRGGGEYLIDKLDELEFNKNSLPSKQYLRIKAILMEYAEEQGLCHLLEEPE